MANNHRTGVGFTFSTPTVAQSSFLPYPPPGMYTNPMTMSSSAFNYMPTTSPSCTSVIQFPSPEASRTVSVTSSRGPLTTSSGAYGHIPTGSLGLPASWQSTVPGNMPWGISPLTTANLMKFTAAAAVPTVIPLSSPNGYFAGLGCSLSSPVCSVILPSSSKVHKRRAEDVNNDGISNKVYINEERMAARMQGMHLDNNNLEWHPNLEEDTSWYHTRQQQPAAAGVRQGTDGVRATSSSASEDAKAAKKSGLPTLELAKELSLGPTVKEILPKSILDEIARPRMQIVLWQPQPDFITDLVRHPACDGATSKPRLPDVCGSGAESSSSSAGLPGAMELAETELVTVNAGNKMSGGFASQINVPTNSMVGQDAYNDLIDLDCDFDDDDDMEL